jgi:hypothetical protein
MNGSVFADDVGALTVMRGLMKKIILMLLLAFASSNAMAEWVGVAHNGVATMYANPATIRKTGNIVKMWTMSDYATQQSLENYIYYFSSSAQQEYDCKEEQFRVLFYSFYSERMLAGNVVFTDNPPSPWIPITPGSFGESMWKVACGKK